METVETSFVELAKQHASFLVALGSALVAILGIMAALWRDGIKSKERAFAANLLCLILTAFAGAQCLNEVGAFVPVKENWESHAYRVEDRLYTLAGVFIYLTAIGFLEVLHTFALHVENSDRDTPSSNLSGLTKAIQNLFLVAVVLYSVVSIEYTLVHPHLIHSHLRSPAVMHVLIYAVPAFLALLTTFWLRGTSGIFKGIPKSVWIMLISTFMAYVYFESTFLTQMEMTDWELGGFLTLVWTTAYASIYPNSTKKKDSAIAESK